MIEKRWPKTHWLESSPMDQFINNSRVASDGDINTSIEEYSGQKVLVAMSVPFGVVNQRFAVTGLHKKRSSVTGAARKSWFV